jgi:four helix bundle protein
MRNFRELKVWEKGIDIVVAIYELTALLPAEEKYGLKSQLQRASISIPSNIAEGCSRESEPDFKKFLEYSIGSAFEIETQLIAIAKLKLLTKEQLQPTFDLVSEEQKMINSFIFSVKRRRKN